jgi:regulator of sirC expression with transglutaminase-like and TPR domain
MEQAQDLTAEIKALAALPDHRIGLAAAALTIARSEYPDLETSRYEEQLNGMAAKLKSRIRKTLDPERLINELNRLLFKEEGFRGNRDDYFDVRNSFLNEVIDRKLGIPITLCIVYIEVGRLADLPLYGIGFPGHFLTGLLTKKSRVVIDPFNDGRVLSESDCRRMVQGSFGGSRAFRRSFLDPIWPKQTLVRLLRNLKAVYWRRSEYAKALQTIQWILILDPDSTQEIKERGLVNEAVGDVPGAIKDLERYLEVTPAAEDAQAVKASIERLKKIKTTIH